MRYSCDIGLFEKCDRSPPTTVVHSTPRLCRVALFLEQRAEETCVEKLGLFLCTYLSHEAAYCIIAHKKYAYILGSSDDAQYYTPHAITQHTTARSFIAATIWGTRKKKFKCEASSQPALFLRKSPLYVISERLLYRFKSRFLSARARSARGQCPSSYLSTYVGTYICT